MQNPEGNRPKRLQHCRGPSSPTSTNHQQGLHWASRQSGSRMWGRNRTDTQTNMGTWDAWHRRKGLLYGSKAAELKPLSRKIFSPDLGEAETMWTSPTVQTKPCWGGPDGHTVQLGPAGDRREWRGLIFIIIFLKNSYLLYYLSILFLTKL